MTIKTHTELVTVLLNEYKKIHSEQKGKLSKWAVHKISPGNTDEIVVPTIPFVGKKYAEQTNKILVYASAENLSEYCCNCNTDRPWLDEDEIAQNRHRMCYDDQSMQIRKKADVIPYVHCGPIETGLLLTAVMYLASKLEIMNLDNVTPRDFCEHISFGNYGKYSKEGRKNIDYAGNIDLMEVSHRYIKADIENLTPDYIILPGSMYKSAKKFIDSIKGNATIIPIYQMLSRNVNSHIAPNERNTKNYRQYQVEELHPSIQTAYSGITSVKKEKYLYVFGYLDDVIDKLKGL